MSNRTPTSDHPHATEDHDDRRRLAWERATEWPLTILAVLYLAAYAVPILSPSLPPVDKRIARIVGLTTWVAFAVDYLVRLTLASQRRRFVRDHIFDALVVALPLLRPLRLLRLVLILNVLNRRATLSLRGRVVTYVVGAVILLAFVGSLAVLQAERASPRANITTYQDSVWWAVSTMTTVGYGDRFPTTWEGRVVAAGLMLAGIALIGVITAAVAAWFVEHVRKRDDAAESRTQAELASIAAELKELRQRLDDSPAP